MNWYYQSNPDWLRARKKYLPASEIKDIIPLTPTGKTRNTDSAMLTLWAKQQCEVSEDDVVSRGKTARGHILEQYAIQQWNLMFPQSELFHWDDTLIHNGLLSWSPDSTNFMQPSGCTIELKTDSVAAQTFTVIAEVKSYAAATHYAMAAADKMTLEERWQIATAMVVSPNIQKGILILYNPECRHPLFYHIYTREELENEMVIIMTTADDYFQKAKELETKFKKHLVKPEKFIPMTYILDVETSLVNNQQ